MGTERCPLLSGTVDDARNAEDICSYQCGDIRDEANRTQKPHIDFYVNHFDDDYIAVDDECKHHDVGFTHEAVQVDGKDHSKRWYSIVTGCLDDCGVNLFEESYEFTCPHSN